MPGRKDPDFCWPYWPSSQEPLFRKGLKPPPCCFPIFFFLVFFESEISPRHFPCNEGTVLLQKQKCISSLVAMNPSSPSSSSTQNLFRLHTPFVLGCRRHYSDFRRDGYWMDVLVVIKKILCLHHLVGVILERDVSQRHQFFSLLI